MDKKKLWLAITVSALGYFVDVYDIILFSAVRVPSLRSLGLAEDQITNIGLHLINLQLVGMLLGGVAWGILGDKRGRLSILFGSIFLYSSATLANAFVDNVETYGLLRFIAGFGLAGEMGAGITLVNELMAKEKRGYGTMIIVTFGIFGGIAGGLVGNLLAWQTAYLLGGLGGFLLLFLRMGVAESGLFVNIKNQKQIARGNLLLFFKSPILLSKYLKCLLVGAPFWVFIGLFMALAPEIGKALNISSPITAAWAILFFNIGLGFGDLSSSILSQILGSRKKVIMIYLVIAFVSAMSFLLLQNVSSTTFYCFCTVLGLGSGSWAIFIMVAAEQFGTNMRATVTTSLPNFVRSMAIPYMAILSFLKPNFGILLSLGIVSMASIILSFISICLLKETFASSLDFVEN
ncbi:MAG: MFS transporter [Proteobacteria bacterium]|nr:MFS transporter [Pseudomonadota bacterium]